MNWLQRLDNIILHPTERRDIQVNPNILPGH